jgi:hypothetical protein
MRTRIQLPKMMRIYVDHIVLNTVPDIFPEDVCEGAAVDEDEASHLFRLQFLDLLNNNRIDLHTKRSRRITKMLGRESAYSNKKMKILEMWFTALKVVS